MSRRGIVEMERASMKLKRNPGRLAGSPAEMVDGAEDPRTRRFLEAVL
jgi:hypothetical protein